VPLRVEVVGVLDAQRLELLAGGEALRGQPPSLTAVIASDDPESDPAAGQRFSSPGVDVRFLRVEQAGGLQSPRRRRGDG